MILLGDHKVSEVICLQCFRRWIAARPVTLCLRDLECPTCHASGYAIETGETNVTEELLKKAREGEDGQ